ncbi:uncharacterized protein TNCV_1507411 [Trichonephila clavipes]|nr:uncharacterized protein TNCV_1507411 [Trichonephila clavipes]
MACEKKLLESEATTGFFVLLGTKGKKETLEWCMKANLIASRYECPRCKKQMRLQERKGTVDGYEWRCRSQSKDNPHDVVRSVRKGTWFSESKLAITIILRLTRYWFGKSMNAFVVNDDLTVTSWWMTIFMNSLHPSQGCIHQQNMTKCKRKSATENNITCHMWHARRRLPTPGLHYATEDHTFQDKAILVQLARRHTLAEARRVGDIEANRKRMSRAKSLEGFDNDLEENLEDEPSGIRSHLSGAPSVVITESELVSSQLYKDRKAKINSDDESIDNPKSDDPDNYEPRRLHDPSLRPVPVPMKPRREKFSSCCCYFLVIVIICLSSLGIIAAIGGVIYMELFTVYKERIVIPVTEIPISSDMKHLVLKENLPHTADEKEVILSVKEIYNQETLSVDGIQNSKKPSFDSLSPPRENKILYEILKVTEESLISNKSDSSEKSFHNIEINKETNSNLDPQLKEIDETMSSNLLNDFSRHIHSLDKNEEQVLSQFSEHDTTSQISHKLRNTGEINQESKVFETGKISTSRNVAGGDNENHSISDKPHEIKLSDSNINPLSAKFENLGKFNKEAIAEDFKLKLDPLNTSQTFFKQNPKYSDISIPNKHLADDSSIDVTKIITTKQDTSKSFEQKQIVLEANAKEEFSNNPNSNASHKEVLANNTTNLVELNRNEILKQNPAEMDSQKEHSVNHIGIVEQDPQAKNISELDSEYHNNSDSSQLMLLHPVVESKAIPVPVEFLRRLGFDIKNAEDNKPLSAKDMEIKFSLAEALKYLRSLDTENRLPTSRKKINQNIIKQNASKNPEPVDEAERKEYLKKLRIKLFEEEN